MGRFLLILPPTVGVDRGSRRVRLLNPQRVSWSRRSRDFWGPVWRGILRQLDDLYLRVQGIQRPLNLGSLKPPQSVKADHVLFVLF